MKKGASWFFLWVFNKTMKFNACILIVLLITFYGACLDSTKTIDSRVAGWKITPKYDPSKGSLQSIEGNYRVIKYWQVEIGGSESSTYSIIRSSDTLNAYWNNQMSGVTIDKPEVDFTKNVLVIIRPGYCDIKFKYKMTILEKDEVVEINISNYLVGSYYRLWKSYSPIFAFEIPAPSLSKEIKVHFNINSRSYGVDFPK